MTSTNDVSKGDGLTNSLGIPSAIFVVSITFLGNIVAIVPQNFKLISYKLNFTS